MVEAKNFVEKTLGKNMKKDPDGSRAGDKKNEKNTAKKGPEQRLAPEVKYSIPEYTPPTQNPADILQQPQPLVQVVERIIYKKQRIHGFFRTLTIMTLLVIGFLMLGESTGLLQLSINGFRLYTIYPLFIILSSIIIRSYRGIFGKIFGLILFLTVFGGLFTISVYTSLHPSNKWKIGDTFRYSVAVTSGQNMQNNLSIKTLIGDSSLVGNSKNKTVQGTRNSDRHLVVTTGSITGAFSIDFNEDPNRNILENYVSNITILLPQDKLFDLLSIKNILGSPLIDLTNVQWNKLIFHGGINTITTTLGEVTSGSRLEIQGAAENIVLNIPSDIGVNMYYKHLVGMLDAPGFNVLTGHYYQSQNISGATTMLHVYINVGLGKTKINWTK